METFKEIQESRKSAWVVLYLFVLLGVVFAVYQYLSRPDPQLAEALPGLVMAGAVALVLWVMNLQTEINEQGITVKWGNWFGKPKTYLWSEIQLAQIRKYNPLMEYGGWGYRRRFYRKKRAFSISGNMGIELLLSNGQTVMIGTQQPEKMQHYLDYLKQKYQLSALA